MVPSTALIKLKLFSFTQKCTPNGFKKTFRLQLIRFFGSCSFCIVPDLSPHGFTLALLLSSISHFVSCGFFQEHKVLLTGTPLQNTVEELFSLLHFLEPAQFPSETEFLRDFGDLKTEEQVRHA